MKKTIFKKLLKDITIFFLISTISLSIIIWIIQAVNFLDLISEDGHSLKVYFLYTIFLLPKIISKILPFIFMISLFYTIIKYETNNELVIYWLAGVSKLNFTNIIIIISFYFYILQIILTVVIVPVTLDKGRSFFRSSNVDLFSTIIKEKKFNDTIKNLTIFVERKKNNKLKNILIKERSNENSSQITIAKEGEILDVEENKIILLKDGKIINNDNNNQSIINFSEFNLDLAKYSTNTITNPKTQEMHSIKLLICLNKIIHINKLKDVNRNEKIFPGCSLEISDSIVEEFIKRFFMPIFILTIGVSSVLIIFFNKDSKNFRAINISIFIMGIILIFLSEVGLSHAALSLFNAAVYVITPIILFCLMYSFFLFTNIKFRKIT